jgi:hypothetical protein
MALSFKFAFEKALANQPAPAFSAEPVSQPLVASKPEDLPVAQIDEKMAAKPIKKKSKESRYSADKIDLKKYSNRPKPKPAPKRTQPRNRHLPDNPRDTVKVKKLLPETRVTCLADAEVKWHPSSQGADKLLTVDLQYRSQTGVATTERRIDRELVIGVDLGTSSTKVVIADRTLKQAYAIPFTDGAGVMSYLLPTLLVESDGAYSLSGQGVHLNDLKLAMMAKPDNPVCCARVAAFLALVIQQARAWLFQNHRDQYTSSEILWSLALGQPADQLTSATSKSLFRQIGQTAWSLANTSGPLSVKKVLDVWSAGKTNQADTDEFQCLVMPELAAQIHGYVSSSLFDPRRPNIFLMVDVGAGTVDASIFRVYKDETGTTSFNLFTNSVEAYGVANLHRHRVNWWQNNLVDLPVGSQCVQELQQIKLPTEYRGFFPSSFKDYVQGVDVQFLNGEKSPDESFFDKINQQLVGEIFGRAKNKRLLGPNDIDGMPYFLCGGGARHLFYEQIKPALQRPRGATWLNLVPKPLSLPANLRAEGVSRADYDRLSVAYGLSQLNLGTVNRIAPMKPLATVDHYSKWGDNYADKDFC